MQTNIEPIKKEVEMILYENHEVVVTTSEQYTHAGDVLKIIKNKMKSLEEQRKSYTAPLDEAKKTIMADFKEVMAPLEQLEATIRSTMITWASAEQKRLDEEQRKIDEAALAKAKAEKLSVVDVPVINTQIKTQRGIFSTNTIVKRWTWKIVNEYDVPRAYLSLDSGKINDAIRKRKRDIPGLEIYQEEDLRVH